MIWIILPVYNEEKNLVGVLDAIGVTLKDESHRVVVVNDGSTDRTASILANIKDRRISTISYPLNGNIGTAFSNGIEFVLAHGKKTDVVVIMESDGTSDVSLLRQFVTTLHTTNADVCIASRYQKGGRYVHFPFGRMLTSALANYSLRTLFPIAGVKDYTIFYRAYRVGMLHYATTVFSSYGLIRGTGFVANAELLVKLAFLGAHVCEIPLVYDYGNKKSRSKMGVVKTIFEYLFIIIHFYAIQEALVIRSVGNQLPKYFAKKVVE